MPRVSGNEFTAAAIVYITSPDVSGNELTVAPFAKGNNNQKWRIEEQVIRNRKDPDRVFDVLNENSHVGAKVGCWEYKEGLHQHWTIQPA